MKRSETSVDIQIKMIDQLINLLIDWLMAQLCYTLLQFCKEAGSPKHESQWTVSRDTAIVLRVLSKTCTHQAP